MAPKLNVIKIAKWKRTKSTQGVSWAVLLDSRSTLYVRQAQPGTSGPEYLKKVTLDLANGTASEEILVTANDGIAIGGLKVFGKGIKTMRFGGYGEVGGDCPLKGVLYDLDNVSKYICICDGYSNCNLTSNLAKIGYDPVSGYLICGGGCSGRWIWVIDPNNLKIVGRASESYIRNKTFPAIEIVPRDDNKAFVLVGMGRESGEKYFRIGIIDIDDLIENISSTPNIDELGSWKELYKTNKYSVECFVEALCNGEKITVCLYDGTNVKRAVYDPSANSLTELRDLIPRSPLFRGWHGTDTENKKHYIYDSDASTILQEIDDSDIPDKAWSFMWFSILADTSNQVERLEGLSLDGSTVPWIEWDLENNKFRIIDFITGNEITVDAILMWSRLQYNIGHFGTLPYIANNRVQKITVSGWTDIPNPPSRDIRVLYVIPDFLGVSTS